MANLNKTAIAKEAGVSYKTVQRNWKKMSKAVEVVSHESAVVWFRSGVSSRVKKSPRRIREVSQPGQPDGGDSVSKPSGTGGIIIGGDYPVSLSIDEAKKLTEIEKNKAAVAKYHKRVIRLFVDKVETELNAAFLEIRNFLEQQCNLTQEQSGKLNSLVNQLVNTLRDGSDG